MTTSEYIAQIKASTLRPEIKEQVLALLADGEPMPDVRQQIVALIQSDIEADLASIPGLMGSLENDDEYQALVAKNEAALKELEQEVQADADFVASTSEELNTYLEDAVVEG